ncbi:MAG: polyphosphate polymerase domain-containing protein [Lachnospiraceae bacterium]|nr:polyphosphate polymerase domain-containing protein [Lachnospiraceae bacterium]
MAQCIFKRLEIKYLLSEKQYNQITDRLSSHMEVDEYGLSTISSIYYDTENYDIIRTSLEKPEYKEKLRLRTYGEVKDDSVAFLELKKKYDGVVYKRRITLPLKEAEDYLNHGIYPSKDSQILREIDYFIKMYKPTGRTYVAYDRIAMYGIEDESLRITFDKNIRTAFDRGSLRSGKEGSPVIKEGERLMEIKASGAMPMWLVNILSDLKIYPVSFSKYGTACKLYMDYGKASVEYSVPATAMNKTSREYIPSINLSIRKFA